MKLAIAILIAALSLVCHNLSAEQDVTNTVASLTPLRPLTDADWTALGAIRSQRPLSVMSITNRLSQTDIVSICDPVSARNGLTRYIDAMCGFGAWLHRDYVGSGSAVSVSFDWDQLPGVTRFSFYGTNSAAAKAWHTEMFGALRDRLGAESVQVEVRSRMPLEERVTNAQLILIGKLGPPGTTGRHTTLSVRVEEVLHDRDAAANHRFKGRAYFASITAQGGPMLMDTLIAAIVDDDASTVAGLLKADNELATRLIRKPKLYTSRIFHWIYVGDTALHLAAAGYRVEIIRLLLKSGADPNAAKNRRRSSPLHYAADGFITGPAWHAEQQVETIRCLLQKGADIQLQDLNGATPLHRAVRTRCAAAVRFLLSAGSDPTMRNKSGSTPFHLAVQNTGRGGSGAPAAISAQREIIEEFLSFGVSPNLRNGRGKSVLDCARSGWIREVLA